MSLMDYACLYDKIREKEKLLESLDKEIEKLAEIKLNYQGAANVLVDRLEERLDVPLIHSTEKIETEKDYLQMKDSLTEKLEGIAALNSVGDREFKKGDQVVFYDCIDGGFWNPEYHRERTTNVPLGSVGKIIDIITDTNSRRSLYYVSFGFHDISWSLRWQTDSNHYPQDGGAFRSQEIKHYEPSEKFIEEINLAQGMDNKEKLKLIVQQESVQAEEVASVTKGKNILEEFLQSTITSLTSYGYRKEEISEIFERHNFNKVYSEKDLEEAIDSV